MPKTWLARAKLDAIIYYSIILWFWHYSLGAVPSRVRLVFRAP
jgi:hypothetical protein